jgi:ribosomal protein S18 acetylase RimI-like enzyme
MNIQLIKAQEEDLEYLVTLRMRTMNEHLVKAKLYLTDQEHRDSVENRFECAYLILFEGENAGFIKYEQRQEELEIIQLQIHPDFQGQGLGQFVLEHMKSLTRVSKSKLILKVLKANPAKDLYHRSGFVTVGEDEYQYHMEQIADK